MGCYITVPPPSFNYALFIARYPEFTSANPGQLAALFLEAQLYYTRFSNPNALVYLNMLTAHIGFIGGLLTADGQPKPVGRVSQAAEGSVSASFEGVPPTPGTGAWFQQSQYGAAFWQATSAQRGMKYRPRPTYSGFRRVY